MVLRTRLLLHVTSLVHLLQLGIDFHEKARDLRRLIFRQCIDACCEVPYVSLGLVRSQRGTDSADIGQDLEIIRIGHPPRYRAGLIPVCFGYSFTGRCALALGQLKPPRERHQDFSVWSRARLFMTFP